ncbi:hypothetical protein [Pseudoalteromonas sp. Of7M-16]|uniref:hypothetical protein n=1 Tax=Pseudoalteromonas sp. Of7M-16 TaxID=2917756 RepID=UPI001EF5A89C|nr:hypothetical protein [Pseudoalteromonas sp. Of7M-16]MCG7550486.1 hypothetical protein [Pseudoalteromonas sp. Of7M-16]
MRTFYIALMFFSYFSEAQEPAPLASCLSYEVSRIDKDMGKFILQNVFAPQLFENLDKRFPDQDIDWSAWTLSVDEYKSEDDKEKTKLKGCFDITKIQDNNELISSIMRVSMTRFQAAMKFYSKPSAERIPKNKIESMLDGYEDLLKNPKVKQAMKGALEHNNQVQATPSKGPAG